MICIQYTRVSYTVYSVEKSRENYKNKKVRFNLNQIQDNLINKQIKLENLKKNIKFKYETYDNLNKTFSKLKDIKHEYNGKKDF